MMNNELLQNHIQAIIFATDQPIPLLNILEILHSIEEFKSITQKQLEELIDLSIEQYKIDAYPFQIIMSGGGYQFATKEQYFKTIAKINEQKFNRRLSNTALETLSIVAYKQPVTKLDIEQIRGVNADYAIQRLLERNLIYIAGRKEDAIGKPLLYKTTEQFLDYLGIQNTLELPQLSEFQEDASIPSLVPPQP